MHPLADIWIYLLHPLIGRGYQWWSGLGSDFGEITIVAGLWAIIRHQNCHVKHCWRLGGHPVANTAYKTCRKHHPDVPNEGATVDDIHAAHEAANALAGGSGPDPSKVGG